MRKDYAPATGQSGTATTGTATAPAPQSQDEVHRQSAARPMNANAQVAMILAHVALVESRRRTIIETIQSPAPKKAELNSRFFLQHVFLLQRTKRNRSSPSNATESANLPA
jgi:hypothetical protein